MSLSIPANEQGKLSGAIAGIMSISAIIGPLLMNNLFAICTGKNAIIELPGAPMLLGSLLIFIAVISVFVIFRNNK